MLPVNAYLKFILLFMLSTAIWLVWDNNKNKPRIFVVHSYNTNFSWVNSIDEGINQKLKEILPSAQIRHHYMDLKRHSGCNFRRRSTRDVLFGINDWNPEYLLLVDDLAQELIGSHYLAYQDGQFPDKSLAEESFEKRCPNQDMDFYHQTYIKDVNQLPNIVFAGVNHTVEPYGYFKAINTQGVYEHKNFSVLVETLTDLNQFCGNKKATAILPLNDNSTTAKRELVSYRNYDWSPLKLIEPTSVSSFDEWKAKVAEANAKNAMLIIANYQQVPMHKDSHQYVPSKKLLQWTTENAQYPVLGAGNDFVNDGGMITVAVAGREQGNTLVELMQFPPQRKPLQDQDVRRAKGFLVGLATRKLKQYCGNSMPQIYKTYVQETDLYRYESISEVLYATP